MAKTIHIATGADPSLGELIAAVQELLDKGKAVAVTVSVKDEMLSPAQAGQQLGFSRQHVVRLIEAGELEAEKMAGSNYWKIPLGSVLDFEARRARARKQDNEFARNLTRLGAPRE